MRFHVWLLSIRSATLQVRDLTGEVPKTRVVDRIEVDASCGSAVVRLVDEPGHLPFGLAVVFCFATSCCSFERSFVSQRYRTVRMTAGSRLLAWKVAKSWMMLAKSEHECLLTLTASCLEQVHA
jgi:hypothetical protein